MTLAPNKLVPAACALALAGLVPHAAADTVALTNGDTLTGSIVQSDERGVILKHPILGTIPLSADRIAGITYDQTETDEPHNSRRPTDAGQENSAPADLSGVLRPLAIPEQQVQDAKAAAIEDRGFWQRFSEDWNSRLTLGLNGSQGPTDKQDYRVKFKTAFEDGADRFTFDTAWYYAESNSQQNQNQFQANLTRDWLQKDKPWFFFVKGQYRFDDNRAWENRTSAFGGGGYTLTKTDDVEVNTRLGFGGTYEYGSVNDFTPEALFGGSIIKWHVSDRAAISGEALYYPSLEDSANFRIESSLVWTYKLDLADGLALKLGLENEYDSATPNEEENNDLRYYGAVVLSF